MTGGEFVVNQQVAATSQPDWKTRADYLQALASSSVFNSVNSNDIARAVLDIVTGKT